MVNAIKTNYRQADINEPTRKMLEFVEKMTLKAYSIEKRHVDELRKQSFTDEDILDIAHITGYFNHINRLADALGVDLEEPGQNE